MLRSYGLAFLAAAAAIGLTRVTWPFFAMTPFAPVFGAVLIATHWGSGGAGLFSIALSSAGALAFFPRSGPVTFEPRTTLAFIVVALVGSLVMASRDRNAAALRASEARLRQAQKMEAIGQLVAGVAHNFNNLLTVTMGYIDVVMEEVQGAGLDPAPVEEIRRATQRGAALTRQLLAFSRKQDARLVPVDVNKTVATLEEMLAPVLPEDIQLQIEAGESGIVLIDPSDLEQVVLNLVFNARDALPSGGAITIDVGHERLTESNPGDVAAGDYVRLRVRDDGLGMSPEVQAHLFEPFFTTKDVGEGTGMGLPFVLGIAQNSGGFVTVTSAPGQGTTVSVYFSASRAPA